MKIRKALLAERLATEQGIQSIESRMQSGALTDGLNGTLSVSIPITPGELMQLAASDALLGTQRSRTGQMVALAATSPAPTLKLITGQMRARRWHCSTSRLQR